MSKEAFEKIFDIIDELYKSDDVSESYLMMKITPDLEDAIETIHKEFRDLQHRNELLKDELLKDSKDIEKTIERINEIETKEAD